MYGPGAGPAGFDACTTGDGVADSTVYRVSVGSLAVDQVIPVGKVPKFLAVTPDGSQLVVSNWCGDDVSIVDTATGQETRRVHVGRNPRGLAITPDSRTAYVALMGGNRLAVVDLATGDVRLTGPVGGGPRHLNLSPTGAGSTSRSTRTAPWPSSTRPPSRSWRASRRATSRAAPRWPPTARTCSS